VGCRGVIEIVSGSKYCAVTLFAPGVMWDEVIQNVSFVQLSKYIFLDKQKVTSLLDCLVCAFSCTEALVVASKEIRLEVNSDKTKYMVMSRDQNARTKSHYKY